MDKRVLGGLSLTPEKTIRGKEEKYFKVENRFPVI